MPSDIHRSATNMGRQKKKKKKDNKTKFFSSVDTQYTLMMTV